MNDSSFPLKTAQAARSINGIQTDVLRYSFSDKLMLVITQYAKIGSVLLVHPASSASVQETTLDNSTVVMSRFILGAASIDETRSDIYQLYASRVSGLVQSHNPMESRPVVLCIALQQKGFPQQDGTPDRFVLSEILSMVKQVL